MTLSDIDDRKLPTGHSVLFTSDKKQNSCNNNCYISKKLMVYMLFDNF
jgi:hypothetical protein